MSSGAATFEEAMEASVILKQFICMMQCTSNYPASHASLNINVLDSYRSFCTMIGYSDHSSDTLASQLALAKGSSYFEKHLTLDKTQAGPDHIASLDAREFKEYVVAIKHAAKILGSSKKDVQPEELDMRKTSRKSLHFCRNICKGEKLQREDMFLSRPGHGIYTKDINDLLGKELLCDVEEGSLILKKLLKQES